MDVYLTHLDHARLRLTLTAGPVSLLAEAGETAPRPTVVVTASPPTEYDPAYFQKGITVRRRMLSIDELLDADEVMLTNSSWGLLPVTKVEQKQIGRGKVGPLTEQLRRALLEMIQRETMS